MDSAVAMWASALFADCGISHPPGQLLEMEWGGGETEAVTAHVQSVCRLARDVGDASLVRVATGLGAAMLA